MSLAYWCILTAALLPYLTVAFAKSRAPYNNADPRAPIFKGLAGRAHSAHQNGFEAFPLFAVAVLVASGGAARQAIPLLDVLAVLWIILRIAYVAAYLGDKPAVRSLIWTAGFIDALAILTMPAWHG